MPEGEIFDGTTATPDNPVPFNTLASINIYSGGQPRPAFARVTNVYAGDEQAQAMLDEYSKTNDRGELTALEENAEYLDYVVAEYEVFFPSDFRDSDNIAFTGLIFKRVNPFDDGDRVTPDGHIFYGMGGMTDIDVPSLETGYPENGDTVTCRVAYPMIKGKTDYLLHYKEKSADLEEDIETHFAVSQTPSAASEASEQSEESSTFEASDASSSDSDAPADVLPDVLTVNGNAEYASGNGNFRTIPHEMVERYAPNPAATLNTNPEGWAANNSGSAPNEFPGFGYYYEAPAQLQLYSAYRMDWLEQSGFELPA